MGFKLGHSVNNISVFQLPLVRSIDSKHRRPMRIEYIMRTPTTRGMTIFFAMTY